MPLIHTRVILVRSLYEANIGAASRAMANMGVQDLVLIAPECSFTEVSQKAAATGQHALQNRRVYDDWESFYASEPQGIRVAFTARDRRGHDSRLFSDVLGTLMSTAPQLQNTDNSDSAIYLDLIFGPEHWGLSNPDLDQAHYAALIPTYGDNSSLNLAQAVLIGLFMLRQSPVSQYIPKAETAADQMAQNHAEVPEDQLAPPLDQEVIKRWISTLGFDVEDRKASVFTVVRRLFQHAVPTVREMSSLNAILHQSIRKMGEYHAMRKQLGLEGEEGGKGLPYLAPASESSKEPPQA